MPVICPSYWIFTGLPQQEKNNTTVRNSQVQLSKNEKRSARLKKYRNRPEVKLRLSEYNKKRRDTNPEAYNKKNREFKNSCPERKERYYQYTREWKKANKDKVNNGLMKRYAKKKQSSLNSDIYDEEIEKIYKECSELQSQTGVCQNVDHIVPLVHKDVSGLHVPWNLQILTKEDNMDKSNKFDGTNDNISWKEE